LAALTQVTRWQPQIIDQIIDLDDLRFYHLVASVKLITLWR
jgi:hypothetical protein